MAIVNEYSSKYFSHINIVIITLVEEKCVRADLIQN